MGMRRLTAIFLGTVGALAWGISAQAADLILDPMPIAEQDFAMLPAVSAVNGKWEFDAGLDLAGRRHVPRRGFVEPAGR